MGFLVNRVSVISKYAYDLVRYGLPTAAGPLDKEILFILDGVGGFQFSPVIVRRILGRESPEMGTIWYRWQYGLVGEIWTDLMWIRRNRVMGARLARQILAAHRQHPTATIHLAAFSGGAGIAAFACESLKGRRKLDSLVLGCPALCSDYNLAPALRAVKRACALISHRDCFLLGLGTSIFGTTDRRHCSAAGRVGFRVPAGISEDDRRQYEKLREIVWTPELKRDGHYGGHTGWLNERFLRKYFVPILRGKPLIQERPVRELGARDPNGAIV